MEHKAATTTALEMDPTVATTPTVLEGRPAPLRRTGREKVSGWRPVPTDDKKRPRASPEPPRRRLRRHRGHTNDASSEEADEDEDEHDDDDDSGEESDEEGDDPAKLRQRRSEPIVDDSDEAALSRRLETLVEEGELGESDDDEARPDEELWLRSRVYERLFEHQRTGVRWLWARHLREEGAIVGDQMGLGKTALVASFLGAVFDKRSAQRRSALVLAPATMLAHWRRELASWAPRSRVVVLHRSAEGFDRAVASGAVALAEFLASALAPPSGARRVAASPSFVCCLTSFEALHKLGEALLAKRWGYVVLDEGQKIRNPAAKITTLCKKVRTKCRLLLSGTPVQNSLKELWSLVDFACPGKLGDLESFEAELATPIRLAGYAGATLAQIELGYHCALALKDLIRPLMIRRTKANLSSASGAALPPKTEHVVFCRLTSDQLSLYTDVLSSDDVQRAMTDRYARAQAFRAIGALRKICNHPDLYAGAPDGEAPGDAERSGKLAALDALLRGWRTDGHRALVFSQSLKMLDIVEALVVARRWTYARIDGTTPPTARQAIADDFNVSTDTFCVLLTTRTGGVGMSLVGADRVVLYDPDWNPQTDAQARERAWRLGQTKPVSIYRFICSGTIEEKIYHRQIFKQALTNRVLADPKQRRLFTKSELAELFTLGAGATPASTKTASLSSRIDGDDNNDDGGDDDDDDNKVLTAIWDQEADLAEAFGHDETNDEALRAAAEREARRAVRSLYPGPRAASRPASSADILASIARRDAAAQGERGRAPSPDDDDRADAEDASDTSLDLVRRLADFFDQSRRAPTTADILAHFSSCSDPRLFRSILRQLADLRDGRWFPKDRRTSR